MRGRCAEHGFADSKELDLVYQFDENIPSQIIGDVVRFRQILVNLLSNAIKFTEKGEVVLSIQAQTLSPAMVKVLPASLNGSTKKLTHLLHVKVRDTGIGISAEQQRRLFQVFSQIDASITRRYGGTGLGLTICKRLVEMMGGKIWVESREGEGSVFQFTMPVESVQTEAQPYQQLNQPLLAGRTVLVFEQNQSQRDILLNQLNRWGMKATAIKTSDELTTWAESNSAPDLVLMDARTWQRRNRAMATYIERNIVGARLVLLVTTQTIESVQEFQSASFLLRPVRPKLLHELLCELCTNLDMPEPAEIWIAALASPTTGKLADRHPLRILLAEDNIVNQKVLSRMLERLGYMIDIASNGLEALAVLRNKPYDVVLMDVHMPEMDGITATHVIQSEWAENLRPRIIALTADALEGDRENFLEQGLDDYLSKPVRNGDLVEKLLKCPQVTGTLDRLDLTGMSSGLTFESATTLALS